MRWLFIILAIVAALVLRQSTLPPATRDTFVYSENPPWFVWNYFITPFIRFKRALYLLG